MYISIHTLPLWRTLELRLLNFLNKISIMGSAKYGDSPLKCNWKDSAGSFFKLVLYVVNHTCSLFCKHKFLLLSGLEESNFGS